MSHSLIEVQGIYSITSSNPFGNINIFKLNKKLVLQTFLALDLFDLNLTSNCYKTELRSTLLLEEFLNSNSVYLDLDLPFSLNRFQNIIFSPAFKQGMEFSSDSEGGPKMGPAGEQTEEEKEAIEAYMAYIENERGMIRFMIYRKWYEC